MVYTRTGRSDQNSGGGNRGGSLIGGTLASPPSLQPYNDDGSYQNLQLAYPFMSNALQNPLNILNETSNKVNANLGNVNLRSEEHTSELQSLMRISYAVFC